MHLQQKVSLANITCVDMFQAGERAVALTAHGVYSDPLSACDARFVGSAFCFV